RAGVRGAARARRGRGPAGGGGGFGARPPAPPPRAGGDAVVTPAPPGAPPVDVTDAAEIRAVLRAARPDAVYHLAALSHVGRSWHTPESVFRVNALGALNVLRAGTDAGAGRVHVAGSADVYGAVSEADLPLTEDAPIRPIPPYGASKAAADVLAMQAFLGDGLPTLRVRAFNHTGPGQSASMLVPGLAKRIAEAERSGGSKINVGNLDVVRDLSDVRDVVRAYRLLIEHGTPGEAYNVCSGRGAS